MENISNIEYIIYINNKNINTDSSIFLENNIKIYNLEISNKNFGKLKNYSVIAKLYFLE
jgi:hypothetical protein